MIQSSYWKLNDFILNEIETSVCDKKLILW
jgi:hypothetical protein